MELTRSKKAEDEALQKLEMQKFHAAQEQLQMEQFAQQQAQQQALQAQQAQQAQQAHAHERMSRRYPRGHTH